MLHVMIHNIETDKNNIADYEWEVRINNVCIKRGNIFGHNRKDGWKKLLLDLVESDGGISPPKKKRGQVETIYIDREEDNN